MARSIIEKSQTDEAIDAMIPETKAGWRAERHLYKLFRDSLPDDWIILYDVPVSAGRQSAQIDFLVFVPGMGVCNVDAKGNTYHLVQGSVCLEDDGKDVFEEANAAIHVFDNYVRDNVTHGDDWGAYTSLVVFVESDFSGKLPGGYPYLQSSDLLAKDGTETAQPIFKRIQELLGNFSWRFRYFKAWKDGIVGHLTPNAVPIKHPVDHLRMEQWSRDGLDKEQREISWKIEQNRYVHVRGAAGTGKTIIALTMAVEFARNGKHVLYVCFNRALAEQCRVECPNHKNLGIEIAHFHNVGQTLVNKNYCAFDQSNNLDRRKTLTNMESLPDDMKRRQLSKFDVLLVDEAQDLSNDEIFALFPVMKRDRHIAIFSDENQTIFSTEWSLDARMFEKEPIECNLERNYRNTDKILEHFRRLTAENTVPMIRECRDFKTKEVEEKTSGTQVKTMVEELLSQGRRPRDIVVLSDRKESLKDCLARQVQYAGGTIEFKQYQRDKDGNPLKWEDGKRVLRKWREDKCILAETIQSFKGLEANCVILLLSENLQNQDENDKVRYVGESRAKYELYIMMQSGQ